MVTMKKSFSRHIQIGGYNYKSSAFITKATAIGTLASILAFLNFVPPATFL